MFRLRSLLLIVTHSLLVIGLTSCGGLIGSTSLEATEAQTEATALVGVYMRSMADRNPAQAYALLSSRAQAVYSLADLEQLLQGASYGLFEGYESLEVGSVAVTRRFSTNPAVPNTMAQVKGTIFYQGGVQGTFEANMELEDGQWRLSKVWIVVPPDKLQGSPEALQPTTCSTTILRPSSGQA